MNKTAYLAIGVIAAVGMAFFIVFIGPSFDRLFFQENPAGVTVNNTPQGNSSSTVSLAIDKINFNKTSNNTANMQITFNIHNLAHNTAILETIQYGVYLDGSKIVAGAVGKESDDVIRGQGDFYQVLGNSNLSVKDVQTIKRSDVGENNWNKIMAGDSREYYTVRGIYSIRDNSDLQASGIDRDFELSYRYLPSSSNNNNDNNDNLSPSNAPLKLIQTTPLPNVQGRIDHMAIDLRNQRLFIAELENNSVDVIDLQSGQRIKTIQGLSEPQGIVYVPSLDVLIVANGGDGSVRIFEANSFTVIRSIKLADDVDNIRYDNETGLIYVGYGGGAIAIMNATTGAQSAADIKLGGHPESFQIEKSGNRRIFVNVPAENSITVIEKGKHQTITKWTLSASQNFPMALDENDHRLFVGTRDPAKLIVINTDTGKEVASFDTVKDVDDISYNSENKQIYVSGGEGFIEVFKQQQDADHYNSISKVPTSAGARTSLFVPELKQLYLAVPRHDNKDAGLWIYSINP